MNDEYELGAFEFYFDVVIPCLPGVGLMAIAFGMIDMGSSIESVRTQGKVRVTAAIVSHLFYLLLLGVVVA